MNAILSIITCIAMLFCGADVPATPETATAVTLRNLTIDVNGESITLNPTIRLTGAMGAENVTLQFEAINGEKTLMPIAGQIDAEGIRFAMGNSGNAYTITDEFITEAMNLSEEEYAILDAAMECVSSYFGIFGAMNDEAKALTITEAMFASLAENGTVKDFTFDYEGTSYAGQTIEVEFTPATSVDMFMAIANSGVAEATAFTDSALKLINLASGTEFTTLEEAIAEMNLEEADEEIAIPVTISIAGDEKLGYAETFVNMDVEGTALTLSMDVTATEEAGDMYISLSMQDDTADLDCSISCEYTGTAEAPTSMDMYVDFSFDDSYSYEWEEEAAEEGAAPTTHSSGYSNRMEMEVNAYSTFTDGLMNMDMDMSTTESYESTTDGAVDYSYETPMNFTATVTESLEADGSITEHYAYDYDLEETPFAFSFDLNRAEVPYADPFAGKTIVELTEETFSGNSEDAAMILLSADVMSVAADGMLLASDESVLELIELFNTAVYGETETYATVEATENASVGIIGGADGPTEIIVAESNANGYGGILPSFTVPEGFSLVSEEVEEESYSAEYESANTYFSFYTYNYSPEDASYYTMQDGALVPAEATVTLESYDGVNIDYATMVTAAGEFNFYFGEGFSFEDVQALLASITY